ncbi:growth hormone secretagogue receptor type 1 [Engraulis encrasicolus]|uniref:growth hormone secretagogue receptor type 1 n=1 Tax=Engraulis encrasicolus TaxID=184585 RepID=UPI002FD1DAE8
MYGDSLFPASTLIPVTAVCLFLFLVGVAGNTMTILIIQRFKDMKTTTNLYLSSMAVSDLLLFFSLPFDLYRLWKYVPWVFGGLVCRLYHYVHEGCTYATILHITALSMERYLAICYPLRTKAVVTKRRVKLVILALWAFALLSASPMLLLVGVEYENATQADDDMRQCMPTSYAIQSGFFNTMIWVSTVYFFGPMLCLLFLYGSIVRKLWRNKMEELELRGPCAVARAKSHRQTIKILAMVVLAFAICWLPYHIGRNLFTYANDYYEARLSQDFNVASMVLCYLSASINPVLYNLMSKKYRAAAHRLFLLRREAHRRNYRRGVGGGGVGGGGAGQARALSVRDDDITTCTENFTEV